jgi:hypothetical protein
MLAAAGLKLRLRRSLFKSVACVYSPSNVKPQILEIVCLNCKLDGATLVPEIRKPFDVLAEGLLSEKSRGDKTAIELFLAAIRGWEAGLQRILVR